jgi:hypothetical protein
VTDAVFTLDGGRYVPSELARGPWDPNAQHGGAAAAILGREIEGFEPDPGLSIARITFELLRPVPLAPLAITTETVRPGKRVQLVAASLRAEDREVMRATALRVLAVPGELPDELDPPDRPPPGPQAVERSELIAREERPTNFGDTFDFRVVSGETFSAPGPATVWFRLLVPVVAGETPTPLQRLLVAADFGNGISSALDFQRYAFINPDLTVYVRRMPVGEWVALDAATWLQPGEGGYAESALYDERGRIGRAVQALYVAAR